MLDSNPPAPPAIQGFQADEIFYKGCHGDLPWEDYKTAIRAFTGTDVEAARLTHQQVVALLMMLGRRSDALIVDLQSVLVSNDAILKQNEAMTAVLEELVDVVKQQPVHTLEVADLEVLGDRITGAIGDLQTGMAATVKSAGLRTYVRSHYSRNFRNYDSHRLHLLPSPFVLTHIFTNMPWLSVLSKLHFELPKFWPNRAIPLLPVLVTSRSKFPSGMRLPLSA